MLWVMHVTMIECCRRSGSLCTIAAFAAHRTSRYDDDPRYYVETGVDGKIRTTDPGVKLLKNLEISGGKKNRIISAFFENPQPTQRDAAITPTSVTSGLMCWKDQCQEQLC